jgi:hypothetical protein
MNISRRSFAAGLGALFLAPAIVRAESLMPVKVLKPTCIGVMNVPEGIDKFDWLVRPGLRVSGSMHRIYAEHDHDAAGDAHDQRDRCDDDPCSALVHVWPSERDGSGRRRRGLSGLVKAMQHADGRIEIVAGPTIASLRANEIRDGRWTLPPIVQSNYVGDKYLRHGGGYRGHAPWAEDVSKRQYEQLLAA